MELEVEIKVESFLWTKIVLKLDFPFELSKDNVLGAFTKLFILNLE